MTRIRRISATLAHKSTTHPHVLTHHATQHSGPRFFSNHEIFRAIYPSWEESGKNRKKEVNSSTPLAYYGPLSCLAFRASWLHKNNNRASAETNRIRHAWSFHTDSTPSKWPHYSRWTYMGTGYYAKSKLYILSTEVSIR